MPSQSERTRNNVRMGIFVSASIVLALSIVTVLTEAVTKLTAATDEWTVRFSLRSGVKNIKPGSEVRIGGLRFGEVVRISPRIGDDDQPVFEAIDVVFRIDRKVRLYEDAVVLASTPFIGAEGWIDIPDVGSPERGEPADRLLRGTESPGMLTALLGPENAARADEMIDSINVIVHDGQVFAEFLARVPDEYHDRIVPIIDDVKAATGDTRGLVRTIREENWPQWSGRVDEVLAWAGRATQQIDAVLEEGHGFMIDAREVVDENRENVLAITDNVRRTSEDLQAVADRVRNETLDQVQNLLATAQDGLDRTVSAIQRIREDYDGWSVHLDETLANATLTAQQLRLASIEIRRSPWKLLYRPSQRELEHELLYEAARSFALAASDLKAASIAVQRVLDNFGEEIARDPEAFDRITRNLLDPLERYETAQQRLLNIIYTDGAP